MTDSFSDISTNLTSGTSRGCTRRCTRHRSPRPTSRSCHCPSTCGSCLTSNPAYMSCKPTVSTAFIEISWSHCLTSMFSPSV